MTTLRALHQVVADLRYGDGLSRNVLDLQRLLWSHEVRSEIYVVGETSPEVRQLVRGLGMLRRARDEREAILVHGEVEDRRLGGLGHRRVTLAPRADGGDVAERLRAALAAADLAIPEARRRHIAMLSSARDDGIRPYAEAVASGLRANGHEVTYLGVTSDASRDLRAQVARVPRDADAVIVEHEAGLFRDVPFVVELLRLRLRRIPVILSLHELEPDKFHHWRLVRHVLEYPQRYGTALEALRAVWAAFQAAWRTLRYRGVTLLMGALPRRIVVHSARSHEWTGLLTHDLDKVEEIPLLVRPLEGTTMPADSEAKAALRERLGIPLHAFVFVSPGYFFRRKRFEDVIAALPRDAVLVLAGTDSRWDERYADHVREYAKARGAEERVLVRTEWSAMNDHVAASDCVVLYYEHIFQSGVATQALWAGLPLVLSDIPGFRMYEGAALFARNTVELAEAMERARDPETYARLCHQVAILRELLSPERNAMRYLAGLDLPRRSSRSPA